MYAPLPVMSGDCQTGMLKTITGLSTPLDETRLDEVLNDEFR